MEVMNKRRQQLSLALDALRDVIHDTAKAPQEYRSYMRDALIQRFEFCSDLIWKLLNDYIKEKFAVSIEIARPKPVYKEAISLDIITLDEYETLIKILRDRNLSSHTYNEELAIQIAQRIPAYHSCMRAILLRIP